MEEFNQEEKLQQESIIENPLDEKIEDIKTEELDFSVEERNYSKLSFRKLQKLRVDGAAFGIKIPILKHDLDKPEKKRVVFNVYGVISTIIFAIGLFLSAWAIISLLPGFLESTGILQDFSSNALANVLTLGLSGLFAGSISIFMWLLAIAVLAIIISLICYLFYFVRTFFNLARCSIQEMAYGYEVTGLITSAIILIVLSSISAGVMIFLIFKATKFSIVLIIVLASLLIIFGYSISILVFILIEKKKAKALYAQLSEEEQENFKSHNRAIGRIKSLMKSIRNREGSDSWTFY